MNNSTNNSAANNEGDDRTAAKLAVARAQAKALRAEREAAEAAKAASAAKAEAAAADSVRKVIDEASVKVGKLSGFAKSAVKLIVCMGAAAGVAVIAEKAAVGLCVALYAATGSAILTQLAWFICVCAIAAGIVFAAAATMDAVEYVTSGKLGDATKRGWSNLRGMFTKTPKVA